MKRAIVGALALAAALVALPGSARAQSAADVAKMAEGAQIYGRQCVRCHNARSPMERTDREWLTIINHMRARANLTRAQAQALIFFMQSANGDSALPATQTQTEQGAGDRSDNPPARNDNGKGDQSGG